MTYILLIIYWTIASGHSGNTIEFNSLDACLNAKSALEQTRMAKNNEITYINCFQKGANHDSKN